MSLNADLREFIELLNSRGIEYVIVGAHSLAFHARPRYTGDLDILVRPSPENAAKLVSLLRDFGFAKGDLAESDFTVPEQMIQLGRAWKETDCRQTDPPCISQLPLRSPATLAALPAMSLAPLAPFARASAWQAAINN